MAMSIGWEIDARPSNNGLEIKSREACPGGIESYLHFCQSGIGTSAARTVERGKEVPEMRLTRLKRGRRVTKYIVHCASGVVGDVDLNMKVRN